MYDADRRQARRVQERVDPAGRARCRPGRPRPGQIEAARPANGLRPALAGGDPHGRFGVLQQPGPPLLAGAELLAAPVRRSMVVEQVAERRGLQLRVAAVDARRKQSPIRCPPAGRAGPGPSGRAAMVNASSCAPHARRRSRPGRRGVRLEFGARRLQLLESVTVTASSAVRRTTPWPRGSGDVLGAGRLRLAPLVLALRPAGLGPQLAGPRRAWSSRGPVPAAPWPGRSARRPGTG